MVRDFGGPAFDMKQLYPDNLHCGMGNRTESRGVFVGHRLLGAAAYLSARSPRKVAASPSEEIPMTLCPIAIVAGCQKCPAFKICPLKGMLGDKPPPPAPTKIRAPRRRGAAARKKA